ncbi:hypothetical protein [Fischerella sp. NIES-3754]|uniref:hypothetical protein n=1 Tax=Fischerella sp. NIES-3754 TaxID=1752063 RepID=UPI000A914252|nr:hypothetical protein [Fischerella sp. NIES-3754]
MLLTSHTPHTPHTPPLREAATRLHTPPLREAATRLHTPHTPHHSISPLPHHPTLPQIAKIE